MENLDVQMAEANLAPRTPKPQRFQVARQLLREPKAIVGIVIFCLFLVITIFAPELARNDPNTPLTMPWQPPSHQYWFGTTGLGQDVYSQWLYATRTSMLIGLGVGVVSTFISVVIGVYSGYRGGKVGGALNWFSNVMLVLPSYPLILVIASYIPNASSWSIVLVLGLTSWPAAARMKRSQALTFGTRDFVLAAKLSGISDFRIMVTEVLPNMLSLVFNTFIGMVSWGIFGEAFLRFLGIGGTSTPSWGNMLNQSQQNAALLNGGWWWFVPPGLSITLVILSLTLINYGVDAVSNPKLASPPRLPRSIRKRLRQGDIA